MKLQTMPDTSILLLCIFTWIVLSGFVYNSVRVWKQTGANPLRLPQDDSAQAWIGYKFKQTLAGIFITLLATTIWTPKPIWIASSTISASVSAIGWVLLLTACVLVPIAQKHMGLSWRIGFCDAEKTPLVTHGVFSQSRNPIFLAMRLALLGWFLIEPHAFSLAALLVGEVLLNIQVRLEEDHLSRHHGPAYADYQRRVRRWI